MPPVAAVAFAACALLVAASAAKVMKPLPAVRAIRGVGIPANPLVVRTLALVETVVAVAAMVTATRPAWAAVAASYALFTGFVLAVRRRGGALASCGCFGGPETPATVLHTVVTAAYAGVAVAAVVTPPAALTRVSLGTFVLVLLGAGVVAHLSYIALAVLPRVRAAAQPARG